MYVEVTAEFKNILESFEERKEELGLVFPPKDKSRILAPSSSLNKQANKIVRHVTELHQVLADQKQGYVQAHGGMDEEERDQVDVGADSISRQCRGLINMYKSEVDHLKCNESAKDHYLSVAEGLEKYLKSVVSVHSEMKAVRVARQCRQKKLSRLEVNSAESRAQEIGGGQGKQGGLTVQELQEKAQAAAAARTKPSYSGYSTDEDEELSPEEAQAMEMENERLMEQLSSLNNQVDQVQNKVVQVAELQAVFTEKVLEQTDILDHVHSEAITATENTKGGNEAIRQAIQNKASYRVYILFILLVFSFSLLFLDWYND